MRMSFPLSMKTVLTSTLLGAVLLVGGGLPAQAQKAPAKPAAATGSGTAQAEEPDTLILSDTLTYDDIKKESVFTGNVVMTRGLMTLHADTLTMREMPDGGQFGTATVSAGKLVRVRQEDPTKFEIIEAEGLRAEYNGPKEEIEMIGKAIVTRFVCGKPIDQIKGDRVIYRQATNTYQAFGGPNSAGTDGRVRSVAQPRARAEAALAECQARSKKQ